MNFLLLQPIAPTSQKQSSQKQVLSQVRLKDFSLLKEIEFSEKIKKIPDWSKYMNPILKVFDIIGTEKKQYCLVEKTKYSTFLSELHKLKQKSNKEIFIKIIYYYHSFSPLLDFLERNGLTSLSCELQNIYLDKVGRPIIKEEELETTYFLPLSIHVVKYLQGRMQGQPLSLSSNNADEICEQFISGLDKLHIFPEDYLKEYAKSCRFSLQPYINKQFVVRKLCLLYEILQLPSTIK